MSVRRYFASLKLVSIPATINDGDRFGFGMILTGRNDSTLTFDLEFYHKESTILSVETKITKPQQEWCSTNCQLFGVDARFDNWNFIIDGFFIKYNESWLLLDTTTAVSAPVFRTGGKTSFDYIVLSGALPSGLSLNASSGLISGTPTTSPEVGSFVIRCTDSNGTIADSPEYSFDVAVGA